MYQLAQNAGHRLDLTNVDGQEMREASIESFKGNLISIRTIILREVLRIPDRETAQIIIEKSDALQSILTVEARPEKAKNPNILNEYRNVAKENIIENGCWTGPEADKYIATNLLTAKYPKFKIENVLSLYSPEVVGQSNSIARAYAKQTIRKAEKERVPEISR